MIAATDAQTPMTTQERTAMYAARESFVSLMFSPSIGTHRQEPNDGDTTRIATIAGGADG